MKENCIEVKNLKQYFSVPAGALGHQTLKAVDGVSFCVKDGETLGLVGESGCGKSTLGRTLLYLYPPTSGEILFEGKPVVTPKEIAAYRKQTAMVFQDPMTSLNPRMTVEDLIGEPLDIGKKWKTRQDRRERIRKLMDQVGIPTRYAGRYAHEFSGGQRQRIGIARALAVDPRFLVCDEPVSALDVSVQAQIVNLLVDLGQELKLTCLFIAHDLPVVRYVSHRIAVMYLGKLVEIGASDDVYERPLHPYTRFLIRAVPVADPVLAKKNPPVLLQGDVPSPLHIPEGCPFSTRCPKATAICREKMPELREMEKGHFAACHHPNLGESERSV